MEVTMADCRINICMKRAYEEPDPADGYRVLVDRLWPRGKKKEALELDGWMKGVAPSTELRLWFGHDPAKWGEFQRRYRHELSSPEKRGLVDDLVHRTQEGRVTLVYGAKDEAHNEAVVLRDLLEQQLSR
jgi:uncharacterized protein YeaO (DUF488 family)